MPHKPSRRRRAEKVRRQLEKILRKAATPTNRRIELLRLFGHYTDSQGNMYSHHELKIIQAASCLRITPRRPIRHLTYHPPEVHIDQVKSRGEVDVPASGRYPATGLMPGEVLCDPKIRFTCPLLRRR
ncbi:hypothetical protein KEJ39_04165 [Candidatus Bathyarchaeota archaeon]|nr:hypothetical protein [Candidatus Bathyarchaeota archaeon]